MLRSIVKGTFVSTQVLNKFMDILLKCKKKKKCLRWAWYLETLLRKRLAMIKTRKPNGKYPEFNISFQAKMDFLNQLYYMPKRA